MILGTISSVYSLGVYNAIQAALYKILLRTNYFAFKRYARVNICRKDFETQLNRFKDISFMSNKTISKVLSNGELILSGELRYFGSISMPESSPPNWFYDPFNRIEYDQQKKPWYLIREFSENSTDIKIIWDKSRFGWCLELAVSYVLTGDLRYLSTLNDWIFSWCTENTLGAGPNYKCGQEVSIRMINVILSLFIGRISSKVPRGINGLVLQSLDRVDITLFYAKSQNNNHIISEAAAMFLCSATLLSQGIDDDNTVQRLKKYHCKGRKILEQYVEELISHDGGFSQGSVNYHRMVIDLLSIVEVIRLRLKLASFTDTFYSKVKSAIVWLSDLVCLENGLASNIGANDGTCLFNLELSDYNDYRGSLQLAAAVFLNRRIFREGAWDDRCHLLGVKLPRLYVEKSFPYFKLRHPSGFAILETEKRIKCIFRYPNFSFRPLQSDLLHLDVWSKGESILCDSGTYSYKDKGSKNYQSVQSHNTVQIDQREQMLQVGRFLYAHWPKVNNKPEIKLLEAGGGSVIAGFVDYKKARHSREVIITNNIVTIIDEINNFKDNVVISWHLGQWAWHLEDNKAVSRKANILLASDRNFEAISLDDGFCSNTYLQESKIKVLRGLINSSSKKGDRVKITTIVELL